jgi:hypothetical protein
MRAFGSVASRTREDEKKVKTENNQQYSLQAAQPLFLRAILMPKIAERRQKHLGGREQPARDLHIILLRQLPPRGTGST